MAGDTANASHNASQEKAQNIGAPVLIYDDNLSQAQDLMRELQSKGRFAEAFTDREALMSKAKKLNRADFAVDIDHGTGRELEGLTAIRELVAVESSGRDFLIMALTSHPEHEVRASASGADVFLRKASVKTDALELLTRSLAHDAEMMARMGGDLERELASREYGRLRDTWIEACSGVHGRAMSGFLDDIQDGLTRALRWPFALPEERALLVALEALLRKISIAEESSDGPSDQLIAIVSQGFDLLTHLRDLNPETLSDWFTVLESADAETHLRWVEEWVDEDDQQ